MPILKLALSQIKSCSLSSFQYSLSLSLSHTQVYSDPLSLPSEGGVKIKIWGILSYRVWKSVNDHRHSIKALYYERINNYTSNNSTSTPYSSSLRGQPVVKGSSSSLSLPPPSVGVSSRPSSIGSGSSSCYSNDSNGGGPLSITCMCNYMYMYLYDWCNIEIVLLIRYLYIYCTSSLDAIFKSLIF